jgi:hypothetical protein
MLSIIINDLTKTISQFRINKLQTLKLK